MNELDVDIEFKKYHYWYARYEYAKCTNEMKIHPAQEHSHDDEGLNKQIIFADNTGQMMLLPWKKSDHIFGMDIMSKSALRLKDIAIGFDFCLKFIPTWETNYPIFEANRLKNEAQNKLD